MDHVETGPALGPEAAVSTPAPERSEVVHPDSDGQPIAETTPHFEWIVRFVEAICRPCHDV